VHHKIGTPAQDTRRNVWLANIGQLVLSFCYLAINSEFTAMAGVAEWDNLATSRKGLCGTRPVGDNERSTHFSYHIPGHFLWLQRAVACTDYYPRALFFVRIDVYNPGGGKDMQDDSVFAINFSAISFIALTL
jgi:hypothetical protein